MRLEQVLFIILLVPSKQINWLYTIPTAPWLVAFSIPLLITWSRPTRPVYAIMLLILFTSHNAAQMAYTCFPDLPDLPDENHSMVLKYSRCKCMNNKLALIATAIISVGIVLKRA